MTPGSDRLSDALLSLSLCAGAAVALMWVTSSARRRLGRISASGAVLGVGLAGAIALGVSPEVGVAVAGAIALVCFATRRLLAGFTGQGAMTLIALGLLTIVFVPWGFRFITDIPVSSLTRILMFLAYLFVLVTVPSALVQLFESWEVLWRDGWRRPRSPLESTEGRDTWPKVSIHVPVHAEPPGVVIETLEGLAALDYPNFEVIVIDNNTVDPSLWRPLQERCRSLGDSFRFTHVEGLRGAKAGALNLGLSLTAPDASLIGIVDADYLVRPDWLKRLVGHFDDPTMGFVQPPHDYRGWESDPYLRACYFEYQYFFRSTMVSMNERDAALTVGTLSLIRREALKRAGGWAEWCVTEDSELAIRIHALGYSSVYLTESFGRGLIPRTFLGYKRQRFRWTAGPVQEFKHHRRLLLPRRWAMPSRLATGQRIHHFNHGWDRAAVGVGSLAFPLGAAVVASMLAHHEVVPVPFALFVAVTAILVTSVAMRVLLYRTVLGCGLGDTVRAGVATKSLSYTIFLASLRALLGKSILWRRTDKFRTRSSSLRGVRSAWPEAALATACFGLAGMVGILAPHPGVLLMLAIGAAIQGFRLVCAPVLALQSEWRLRATVREARTTLDAGRLRAPRVLLGLRLRPVRLLVAALVLIAITAATSIVMLRLAGLHLPTHSANGRVPASTSETGTSRWSSPNQGTLVEAQRSSVRFALTARVVNRTPGGRRRAVRSPAHRLASGSRNSPAEGVSTTGARSDRARRASANPVRPTVPTTTTGSHGRSGCRPTSIRETSPCRTAATSATQSSIRRP